MPITECCVRNVVCGSRDISVVDAAGGLVGIITLDDMLHQFAAPLAALSELAGRSRRYETLTRT
jgi:CBS domain-containing protein